MKKIVCLLLMLVILVSSAAAEPLAIGSELSQDDYNLTLDSMQVYDEWDGMTSDTHMWIVVGLTFVNYRLDNINLDEFLSASLLFQGRYKFESTLDFESSTTEPLVRSSGFLIFRVPAMVAEADISKLTFFVNCGGKEYFFLPDYSPATNFGTYRYFDEPQDTILYFAKCIARGDFAAALQVSAANSLSETYSLEEMLKDEDLKKYNDIVPMPFPSQDFASYAILNRIGQEDEFIHQLYGFLTSLLVEPGFYQFRDGNIENRVVYINESKSIPVDEFMELFNPSRLANLKVQYIIRYDKGSDSRDKEDVLKNKAIFRYFDATEFVVVYSFDGKLYAQTNTLAKFIDGWQIFSLSSISNVFYENGTARLIEEEFDLEKLPEALTIVYRAE